MGIFVGKIDPKSTGGEGFDFEDKVGAYFLSFLLIGKNPFPSLALGRLITINFQRKVDGWEFDDIILGFDSDRLEKKIAFSVKSNSYITANKFPHDLVKSIWTQYCKIETNPFRSKHDYLGLVTSGTSTIAIETYRKLQNFASRHKGRDLEIHIKQPEFTNQKVRDMFDSFVKPSVVDCNQNIQRAEIIERLIHFDVNLDDPTSPYLKQAFDNLASALVSGEANDLWIKLQHMVKTSRIASGEIKFSILIEELKSSFKIKGHYDLDSDLKKLKEIQETEIGKIKSTIGNNLSVERKMDFSEQFKKTQVNTLIGESGIGKSVLLKQWVYKVEKPVIWLPYSIFKARTLAEINTLLGIKNDLFDILQYGPSEQIIVIDAVDRLTGMENRELLKSFLVKFKKISENRHLCVISSQDQSWRTLVGNLSTQEVMFNVISAPMFEKDELEIVEKELPSLIGILTAGATKEILKNLKYLDLTVQMAERSSLDTSKSISEPVLIRGFWSLLSDDGANQKQALLTKLAVEQADKNDFLSPLTDLSMSESQLSSLVREGILKVQDGYVRFSHDLYGDWIRQRFLLSKRTKTIHEILKRKNNVYWQQSIRLTSLEILETDGFDSWKKEIESLNNSGDEVLVDLFLDIAITSLNQRVILETIKGLLFSDNFKLLHRFLERFLIYATIPNPKIMSKRKEFKLDELTAAQVHRVPLYTYWPSLLQFLADNYENIRKDRSQMPQIAEKWLTSTPNNFPFRKEAAKIAFNCAKWIFDFKKAPDNYVKGDVDKKCYKALLAAYPELPNEIEDLCLKLIGLREDSIERSPPTEVLSDSKAPPPNTFPITHRRIEKKVLPNGPQIKKDREFRDVCLEGQNLGYLIQFNPSLASQILLAAIIDEPQEYEDLYDNGLRIDRKLGTDYTQKFYPPLYSKGPFLYFFKTAPQQALDALISLISLVTDQWVKGKKIGLEIEINGNKKFWQGDAQVFLWAMDISHCPDVVVAFLMALEKWLYEEIDKKENIDFWIDQITKKSNSMALLGVLMSIAKYSPKLFLEKLRSLLALPHVIWWDQQFLLQNHSGTVSMISWSGQSHFMTDLALKWFGMNHRKTSIEQWAIHFLLNIPNMQNFFATARSRWRVKIEEQPDSKLEVLVHKFNPSNYKIDKLSDGTQVWNYMAPKEFLQKNKKRFKENDAQMQLLMFPMNVNKLLDATSFSKDELTALEKTMEYITNTVEDESNDPGMTTLRDCKLAIDGLKLIAAKRKIISVTTTVLNVARQNIEKALKSLWNNPGVADHLHDHLGQKYDTILAKVIGQLAVGDEKDVWIRNQVARLVCGPRTTSIVALIRSAVSVKVENTFLLEIMTFIFEYSKIHTTWHDVEHVVRYFYDNQRQNFVKTFLCRNSLLRKKVFRAYSLEDRRSLFENDVSLLVEKFINGKIMKAWPDWSFNPYDYAFAHGLKLSKSERDVIHLESFTQAISCLSPMEQLDDNLKSGWIKFCSSGLDQISRRLSKLIELNGEVTSMPYEQDRSIIHVFATTYYWHDDVKLNQSLKTFFEVGADGHYWINEFGTGFFSLGLKHPKLWKQLKSKTEKIFDLALSINRLQSSKKSWDEDEIWCSLVGLDEITIRFLPDDSESLIKDLLPLYERMIKTRNGSSKCLSRFITLLCKGVAVNIRIKGLAIVASELEKIDYGDYWQKDYISMYSYFLTTLWQENQNQLRTNPVALDNFQQILNGLISVQDSIALELASQINSLR